MMAADVAPAGRFTTAASPLVYTRLTARQAAQLERRLWAKHARGAIRGREVYLLREVTAHDDVVVARGDAEGTRRYAVFAPGDPVTPA